MPAGRQIRTIDGKKVRVIDRSAPKPLKESLRIPEFDTGDLGFTLIDAEFLNPREKQRVIDRFEKTRIPNRLRCRGDDGNGDLGGFTSEQMRENDVQDILLAVYREDRLVGGLDLSRIKVLERRPRVIRISAVPLPAFARPGTTRWVRDVLDLMEYFLDNRIPTSREGVELKVARWEIFENSNAAFRHISGACPAVFDDNHMASRDMETVDSPESLPDGRKIVWIRRPRVT